MKTTLFSKQTFALVACALLGATTSHASSFLFHIDVNTTPLMGNANGPFSLDFQLNDGSAAGGDANNAVTLSNFNFGGGTVSGDPTLLGGATGNLSSSITITDSAFGNEIFQGFTPGSTLGFEVSITRNVDSGVTPDSFSFAILDSNLSNIPTTGGGDSLATLDLNSTSLNVSNVQTFSSTGVDTGGVTVAAVPEPSSVAMVGLGMAGLYSFMRRRRA